MSDVEITRMIHEKLLDDIEEGRKERLFQRKLIAGLTVGLFTLVLIIILQHIYYDYSFKKFMSQYNFATTDTITNVQTLKDIKQTGNSGNNINVNGK